jgi:uncharacterized protein (TIGR02453 family)
MTNFAGWPTHTHDWFTELEANNNTDWFNEHRASYDEIEAATRALLDQWEAEGGGETKIFRLRRDARFSKGQPPFKTHHQAGIMRPSGIVESFTIDADGITISIGHPMWDKRQLAAARTALADPDVATALHDSLRQAAAHGLDVDGRELKRPIGGLPPDHPYPDLTRHKHLQLTVTHQQPGWLTNHQAKTVLGDFATTATPVAQWLTKYVGPPAT